MGEIKGKIAEIFAIKGKTKSLFKLGNYLITSLCFLSIWTCEVGENSTISVRIISLKKCVHILNNKNVLNCILGHVGYLY